MSACAGPPADCPLCPRLVAFRQRWRVAEPGWHCAPVPAFGSCASRLLIVGLAPGLRGANRTGRPFTGDGAGETLFPTLVATGFAAGTYGRSADDGLKLIDCRITNAVRCAPPENRPTAEEIRTCNRFLKAELDGLPALSIVLSLGSVAHRAVLAALAVKPSSAPFAHGARHRLPRSLTLIDSYHCSRQNTNTGRLTPSMFRAVFEDIRRLLAEAPPPVRPAG